MIKLLTEWSPLSRVRLSELLLCFQRYENAGSLVERIFPKLTLISGRRKKKGDKKTLVIKTDERKWIFSSWREKKKKRIVNYSKLLNPSSTCSEKKKKNGIIWFRNRGFVCMTERRKYSVFGYLKIGTAKSLNFSRFQEFTQISRLIYIDFWPILHEFHAYSLHRFQASLHWFQT